MTVTVPQFVNFIWSRDSILSARKHSDGLAAKDRMLLHSVESCPVDTGGGTLTEAAPAGSEEETGGLGGTSAAGLLGALSVC